METCSLSHVVLARLSLVVLLIVLRPINAWTYTSSSNDMDRTLVTRGYFSPSVTNSEEITALPKYLFTTSGTSKDFREVSSPSTGTEQSHRVRHSEDSETRTLSEDKLATEQNAHLSTVSTRGASEGTLSLSKEQMSSTIVVSTEATTHWEDQTRLAPDHLLETYPGLRVDLRSVSVTQARLPQDSPDADSSLRQDQLTNRGTVGLRKDQLTNRGTAGLGEDQSTNRGTAGLGEDQSTNRGTAGLGEDQSTNRGTSGLGEDQSTNRGTAGLGEDQSTNRGTVGLGEDQSTNRGTSGLGEDQSTNRGTAGLGEDQSTNRGTVGLGEDQSTNRGTVGLGEDQSTNRGTAGLGEDQSTNPGTAGLGEDQSTNRGTVGLGHGQSTATFRQDQLIDLGTVALPVQTDSTYISSTVSRAGERTLLSVTSNNTSMYSEDSNSSSQSRASTWDLPTGRTGAGAGAVTIRIPFTGPEHGHDATSGSDSYHHTNSSQEWSGGFASRGTNPLTGPLNVTQQDLTSLVSEGTPNSTPLLRVVDNHSGRDTDTTDSSQPSRGRTSQTEEGLSASSQPPVLSSEEGPSHPNTSQGGETDRDSPSILVTGSETSTKSSTGPPSTRGGHGETEVVPSLHTEDNTILGLGLTTVPPTLRDSATALDDFLSRFLATQPPFIPKTQRPAVATEVLVSTTPVTVTIKSQVIEDEPYIVTMATSTTPTPPLATTRMVQPSTATSIEAQTQPTIIPTTTTTETTLGLQSSASTPQPPGTTQTQTQGPSTGVSSTDVTTLHLETSTAHSITTTAASYSYSVPTRNTVELHTTGKHTDRGTTEIEVTTAPMDIRSTPQTPGSACEPSPCLNGGECLPYGVTGFTCDCLSSWTGPTCNEDVNECESGPCPSDSTCVNTRGSFSCECPLGLDMEHGRDCTRAKTFLGTFSFNVPLLSRSATLREIQREINQLLNASLSILRGYRRSSLSKKGEDGVRISAVNMFSISTDVTSSEVYHIIQMSLNNCNSTAGHCRVVVTHQLSYHVESLCLAQNTQCHPEHSFCTDSNGTAFCQCQPGYFKLNPEDQTCIECGDGLKRVNGTCVSLQADSCGGIASRGWPTPYSHHRSHCHLVQERQE
ncbi:protein HEG isoform X2 [Salvelinus fontinalis]|uniref:protein HEG isoform X2 n=1 Tax=Salvelinus fontinalis TaxID=8038 RepID=UPI002486124D|nr:protein HEG isoform X2 [Salvelinus fontinalis]